MRLLMNAPKTSSRLAGVLAASAMFLCAGLQHAGPFPLDPVDELRAELRASPQDLRFRFPDLARRLEGLDPDKERAMLNQKRASLLTEKTAALRTLPQMRRALTLNAWRLEDKRDEMAAVDRKARRTLAERFEKQARNVLQHGNVSDQLAAINIIAEVGPSARNPEDKAGIGRDFGPDLAELLKEGHPSVVQTAAARAMGQIFPDPKLAANGLGRLLATGNINERRAAAEGVLGLVRVANQLVTSSEAAGRVELFSNGIMDRSELAAAGKAALSVAGKSLFDPDPVVRRLSAETFQLAATALTNTIPQRAGADELNRGSLNPEAVQAARTELRPLMDSFKEQAPTLARALTSSDPQTRLHIARALEDLAQARSLFERALGELPVKPPVSGAGIDQESPNVGKTFPAVNQRAAPVDKDDPLNEVLRSTISALARATSDPSPQVRLSATEAIETIGPDAESTAPALVKALSDKNLFVRWAAARALGRVGMNRADIAVPGLAKLLDDRDFDVNIAAARALQRFGPAAQAALPELQHALKATDAEKRREVLRTIESIGTGASAAITPIIEVLDDPDPSIRQHAAELLGRFGPAAAQAKPALQRALQATEPEVRRAASEALLNIEGQ